LTAGSERFGFGSRGAGGTGHAGVPLWKWFFGNA
jgi:hypothetical protein